MLLWAFGTYTGKHSKTLQEQSKTSLPFHIVKVNLYYIQRSFGMPVNIYHCAIVVEAHKQAWNKTVQHKRCQRKAGIMNTESSGICSCWCAVKIRLIFSPIKPQELDYSMLNWWKISSLYSTGGKNNFAVGLQSVWTSLFLSRDV